MDIFYVSLGGFLGAISRYTVSRMMKPRNGYPAATLTVNLLGAFLLGIIAGTGVKGHLYGLFGVGFMGAFTTFSTLKLEADQLKNPRKTTYLFISYSAGIFLAFCGLIVGKNI